MKYYSLLVIILVLIGCQTVDKKKQVTEVQQQQEQKETPTTAEIVAQYVPQDNHLEFDEVIHYRNKDLKNEQEIIRNNESLLHEWGFGFSKLNDISQILSLEKIGYKKYPISKEYLSTIKALIHPDLEEYFGEESSCTKIYRDILVFKNQSEVVATVKLCFDCWDILVVQKAEGKYIDLEPYFGEFLVILDENYEQLTEKSLIEEIKENR